MTRRAYPAVLADRVVDPTGAGDAFLAAFLTTRLTDGQRPLGSLGAALRFAATVASFLVERPGLLGVPERSAVAGRLARPRVVTRSGDDDPG